MRALVVDDEPPALSELTYLLEQDGRFDVVVAASSGTDALRALDAGDVDVVFSDISMPGLDGMELARIIARFARRPQVVFVTAHEEHAVDAFAVQATDYVMKPVSPSRLARAVDRVVEGMTSAPPRTRAPSRGPPGRWPWPTGRRPRRGRRVPRRPSRTNGSRSSSAG
ncbi:LytR/AlgR family response regulator transcription factor [Ornithinimicrobium sp. CNJ-824]|uniref:LytR/AlgR family response regulator transcription factor n=1 Tax=Ornithinimicrobium sp. CNJ-824 TaxID=1904966 RepID=UPI002688D963